ncbi:MAG: hypothetical protein IID44_32315, partial [Planctomycetes bacterium]|nr:hypothetical protein [Planctomycetota bacterium]
MNAKRFLVVAAWLWLSSNGSAMAQQINLDELRSKDVGTSAKADGQLRQRNRDAVRICIEILTKSKGKLELGDRRNVAFRVLGSLRDARAVTALCKCIDLRTLNVWVSEAGPVTLGHHYPAAAALAKIG